MAAGESWTMFYTPDLASDFKSVEKYLTITLDNTLISSYNISGHGGGDHTAPMESFSLNYTKIEYAMVSRDDKDKSGGSDRANYDLSAAKAG